VYGLDILPEVLRFTQNYRQVVNGLLLIAIVLFRPDGLITRRRGGVRRWRDRLPHRAQPAPP